ncbi:DUF4430 domain-containing protein [Fictibacillus aquaticus]|uniref:Transcobalamin-like C-terminal domain-containing protein n=1 Tax=Fictibacillus aquaticus TaxID=2021314 RepID=A0A235FAR7_9BACL|nr:DUF4430 domain-containing protein [Fictibacillus aquaticus]OYD58420.1 hypothetical protein CGZ90_00510 [Fictibacillus aquaticus]
MKRLTALLFAAMIAVSGCGQAEKEKSAETSKNTTEENQKQETVTVELTKENGKEKVEQKEVAIKEGETVMEVMKREFDVKTMFDDSFISGINGIEGSEKDKTSWFFSVNGKEAMKGAKEIKLKKGDKVSFDLHKYE